MLTVENKKPRTFLGVRGGYWWPTRPTSSTSSFFFCSRSSFRSLHLRLTVRKKGLKDSSEFFTEVSRAVLPGFFWVEAGPAEAGSGAAPAAATFPGGGPPQIALLGKQLRDSRLRQRRESVLSQRKSGRTALKCLREQPGGAKSLDVMRYRRFRYLQLPRQLRGAHRCTGEYGRDRVPGRVA